MKCSKCGEQGHNARSCRRTGARPPASRAAGAPPAMKAVPLKAVSAADIPAVKQAVLGVVDALEKVEAPHRARVIESARLILGD